MAEQIKAALIAKILRRAGVCDLIGVSKSTLYFWVKEGAFPAPIQLGPRAVGWRQSDVEAWLESRQSARNDSNGEAA